MSLDDDYANAAYIPDADSFLEYWDEAARNYREAEHTLGRAQLNQPYGPHLDQAFDLVYPAARPLGLVVFVHGGYWLRFGRRDFSHLAQGACLREWAVAMPSYPLAPETSIPEITQSIALAITEAALRIAGPIVLVGHSAGGHLVARMLAPEMLSEALISRLRRVVPISPVADLRPLLQTAMNAEFQMDAAEAAAESPVLQRAPVVPVTVWVGAKERPAFLDQARWLAKAWGAAHVEAAGLHHFNVIEDMTHADTALTKALVA